MLNDSMVEGGEGSQKLDMADSLTFHLLSSTWFCRRKPSSIWFYLDLSQSLPLPLLDSSLIFFLHSSHHPSWLSLLLPYFDLFSPPPHTSHPSPPPSLLPLTHIIYLPFLPLPISPSLTSCSPACQTAIINGETIVPLALGSHLHWLA